MENNDKLLRIKQVLRMVNVSRSTWLSGVKTGRFPMGFKNGKCVFWKESEILSFIREVSECKSIPVASELTEIKLPKSPTKSKKSLETTDIHRYSAEEWQIKQLKEKVEQLQSEIISTQAKHTNKYDASLQSDEVGGEMLYDWARKKYGKVVGVHLEKRYLLQCGPNRLRRQYTLDAAINYLVKQKKINIWRKKGVTMISFA